MRLSDRMVNILSFSTPKWYWIVLFQIGLGLLCIFIPWHLVIILSISCALITLFFIKFKWWAYLFVFLIPFSTKDPGFITEPVKTRIDVEALPFIIFLSLIAAFVIIFLKYARLYKNTMKSPLFIPNLIFICYAFLTFFWSPARISSNLHYFIYLIADISLFYFLFHVIDNKEFHKRLMWCLIFSGIVLSVQVFLSFYSINVNTTEFKIFDWLLFDVYHSPSRGKHAGWFSGPAGTASTLDIIIFVAMGLLLTETGRARIWFLRIVIAMFSLAVFLTGNRGGTWSLVIIMYLFLFISRTLRKNFLRNAFLVFIMILIVFLPTKMLTKRAAGTYRAINVSTAKGGSIAYRIQYWKEGFRQLSKRSLTPFGLGIGGYNDVNTVNVSQPHNIYFQMFFDFGFMGVIIICAFIFPLARMFLKIANHQETYLQNMSIAFAGAFVCIGINGLVSITYYLSILWLLLALGTSTFYMTQKELLEEKQVSGAASHS